MPLRSGAICGVAVKEILADVDELARVPSPTGARVVGAGEDVVGGRLGVLVALLACEGVLGGGGSHLEGGEVDLVSGSEVVHVHVVEVVLGVLKKQQWQWDTSLAWVKSKKETPYSPRTCARVPSTQTAVDSSMPKPRREVWSWLIMAIILPCLPRQLKWVSRKMGRSKSPKPPAGSQATSSMSLAALSPSLKPQQDSPAVTMGVFCWMVVPAEVPPMTTLPAFTFCLMAASRGVQRVISEVMYVLPVGVHEELDESALVASAEEDARHPAGLLHPLLALRHLGRARRGSHRHSLPQADRDPLHARHAVLLLEQLHVVLPVLLGHLVRRGSCHHPDVAALPCHLRELAERLRLVFEGPAPAQHELRAPGQVHDCQCDDHLLHFINNAQVSRPRPQRHQGVQPGRLQPAPRRTRCVPVRGPRRVLRRPRSHPHLPGRQGTPRRKSTTSFPSQNTSRQVNTRVMGFVIRYLDHMHSRFKQTWKIKFVGFDVTSYEEEEQKVKYKELTVLKGQNDMDYLEVKSNGFSHVVMLARHESCWFSGVLVVESLELQLFCPSLEMREKALTLMNMLIMDEFNVEAEGRADAFKGLAFQKENQEQDTGVLLQILVEVVAKESLGLEYLSAVEIQSFYEKQFLLDWLLLQTHAQYQQRSLVEDKILRTSLLEDTPSRHSQSKHTIKSFHPSSKFTKPSFANLTQKTKKLDTRDFEDSLMKSMEMRQRKQDNSGDNSGDNDIRDNDIANDTYARFIRKLQRDEEKRKEQLYRDKFLSKLGNDRVEMTRHQFVYMMEQFKQDVVAEIRQEQKHTQASHFIARFLQANNGVVEQDINAQGQLDYNVRLNPDQLASLLQRYEEFQDYQDKKHHQQNQELLQKKQMESFHQFQQLLNYYHQTNPAYYQELLDEYNNRVNQQILESMGLSRPQQKPVKTAQMKHSQVRSGEFNSDLNDLGGRYSKSPQIPQIPQVPQQMNRSKFSEMSKQSVSNSAISFNQQNNLLNQDSIKASRYDRKITMNEFFKLQNELYLSENILNFFIRYLEEKQKTQPQDTLKAFQQRTFLLTTTFFRNLTSQSLDPNRIQYEAASHYTKPYIGKGQTIFDQFDQIVVPIVISIQEITVALIKLNKQEIWYYDTLVNGDGQRSLTTAANLNQALYMNPNLCCVLKFVEMEHNQKIAQLMRNLNLFQWQFKYSGHEKSQDVRQSGLVGAYLIHMITMGEYDKIRASYKEVMEFHNKVMVLISEISITRNRKRELERLMGKLPL